MESEFKTRKPNLATFGQIIYYISSRILKNHSVESRKDVITSKKYGISEKSKFVSSTCQQEWVDLSTFHELLTFWALETRISSSY